jgi:hypothetical protein
MSIPQSGVATHDQYLAEANAELDAMLGEVGELDSGFPLKPVPGRSWMQLVVVAVIAVAVFAVGVLLLRSLKPRRMDMHLTR